MYRLKASFTVTVLETRTDQNSFFTGSPLERTLDYPFSGTPGRQWQRSVPSRLTIDRRNSGTDWPGFPPRRDSLGSCTIFTRVDTNGESPSCRRIKFVSLTSRTMCSSVIYSSLRAFVIYRHTWVFIAGKFTRERNILIVNRPFIRRSRTRLFVYTLEKKFPQCVE